MTARCEPLADGAAEVTAADQQHIRIHGDEITARSDAAGGDRPRCYLRGVRQSVVRALGLAFQGDVAGSRALLDERAPSDDLATALHAFAAADYATFDRLAADAPPEHDAERIALRSTLRALKQVESDGRVVVPVDEEAVAANSPVAGLIGYLMTETAYSAGLLERSVTISERVLRRTREPDPFRPWVRISRLRVLCFLGMADAAATEMPLLATEIATWPLGPAILASQEALVASLRGDADGVLACALRNREAAGQPSDQLGAMAVALCGLALSTIARPDLAMDAIQAAGPELELLPVVSRCHVGDLAVDSCLRLGRVDEARRHLRRSESFDLEPGSFCAAAVERSRARLRALDGTGVPDPGPHAEMYLTRDRALADVAALPTGEADIEELTRLIAGAGLAAVRSWAGREPGNEESTLQLFAGLGWDALPAQARVVARLAASGLRNREIAAAMFIAEKTVESYVGMVMATLGTDTRVGIGGRVPFHAPAREVHALSPRQAQVAELIAQGLSNEQIGDRLGISVKTVEKHVAGLFRVLGVGSRSAVAAIVRDG